MCNDCGATVDTGIYHDCKGGKCSCYVGNPTLCEYHRGDGYARSMRAIQLERAEAHATEAIVCVDKLQECKQEMELTHGLSAIVHAILSLAAATAARGE